MSITLKIARTAKELDDVFKLRYEVYVLEKGRFSLDAASNENKFRIVDRFDTIPDTANIIAYDNNEPVACMRVNKDSEIGLPAEIHFDFLSSRALSRQECAEKQIEQIIVSAGMLAIKDKWRNQRNIIHAMFKTAISIIHNYNASHIITSVSKETQSLYGRLGFEAVGESKWCESIGDDLVPMLAPFNKVLKWGFGNTYTKDESIWLEGINYCFERIILSAGEALFYQNDVADNAYVIEEGWISISKMDSEGNEMVLSNLSTGELFGELSLFDQSTRSATATALTNTEVVAIPRAELLEMIKTNAEQMGKLLSYFAKRLRDMDDQAMIQLFAPQTARIHYELEKLWSAAAPDRKNNEVMVARVGPSQLARSAHVHLEDVMTSLENEKIEGNLEYSQKSIRFFKKPVVATVQ
ncbi:MAG: cyclic nucleotide-binding domain-containing protein [Gammaproteobacteria bacterium]|nr:cyclic nucleotide-binding domain-containing protein [Gammaproteobacteria bacterium]